MKSVYLGKVDYIVDHIYWIVDTKIDVHMSSVYLGIVHYIVSYLLDSRYKEVSIVFCTPEYSTLHTITSTG